MKTIGFIDYYLSEWHANNYPNWIKQACEGMDEEFIALETEKVMNFVEKFVFFKS